MEEKKRGLWSIAKNKEADIYIYETIGDSWLGGISAKDFSKELKAIGNVDLINVFISSDGGSVFDGVSIFNQLKRNKARIITNIDGIAASIASLIAMAGDEVYMAANAQMMIHKAWAVVSGNADEIRKQADILDKIDADTLVNTYAAKSGRDNAEINQLLEDETWLTADEAMDLGLVDNITEEIRMAAYFDLSRFKNAPNKIIDFMEKLKEKNDLSFFEKGKEYLEFLKNGYSKIKKNHNCFK